MASGGAEMTCKSVDVDHFNLPLTSEWLDAHTAPVDGEAETGALPLQAAALGRYLHGESNVKDTVAALTAPAPDVSESEADLRDRVFGIIEDALFELSENYTPALVALLRELDAVPGVDDAGRPIWKGLKSFGDSWSDSWKQSHWRKALATRDRLSRELRRDAHVHRAYVEAACAVAGAGVVNAQQAAPGSAEDGILPLSWGYECLSDALERQEDVVRDFEIPAAAVWIRVAGKRLVDGATRKETSWALEREGRLWPPGPMSIDRWRFWLKRLEEAKSFGGAASEAAESALAHVRETGLPEVESPSGDQLSGRETQSLSKLPTPRQRDSTESSPHTTQPPHPTAVRIAPPEGGAATGRASAAPGPGPGPIALLDGAYRRLKPTREIDGTTRESIYLGRNCAASFFRALVADHHAPDRPLLPSNVSIESAFGLTNRTTLHPFGSLWSFAGDVSLKHILESLPAVEALGDEGIAKALQLAASEGSFQDAAWYGVLFGVLACGCQFYDNEAASDRLLKARVFVAAAFECLRLANLFGMPSEATIQALLMIELVIANDANPGMAWSLIGTTAQNAQSIGLHVNMNDSTEWCAAIHPLWSAIWFLDSSLSLAFGRRPSSFVAGLDRQDLHIVHGVTFPTFCSWTGAIHKLKLNWQLEPLHELGAGDDVPSSTTARYLQSLANLEVIPPYGPRSGTKPSTIHRRVEQLVSLIHINHCRAEILRVSALSCALGAARRAEHLEDMMRSLDDLVAAYCTLKPLSATMTNSWPILYATMSAALILAGIRSALGEPPPPVVARLVGVLSKDVVDEAGDHAKTMGRNAYADGLRVLRHLTRS
ncbi:fungal specific transcription factordomain-containing protein [Cordyceps javanica]|uniref:Fungal specific transcription factordomain-containing protein n=1 Tax=Cordyceps javanica TaxID=43265 RepID=A0A545V0W9_9HYPO|nr:fungal specific transcription factordomain-containing protein [Cordyceps javanica]TQW02490.1 fungal specific transcription factor domain-containing protein [Cordyceps javanica]